MVECLSRILQFGTPIGIRSILNWIESINAHILFMSQLLIPFGLALHIIDFLICMVTTPLKVGNSIMHLLQFVGSDLNCSISKLQ